MEKQSSADNRFSRTERLLGQEAMQKLSRSRVAVFGVGGVGGYVVEALARSGIGAIDLCDKDEVDLTNLNRQIIALQSTVGQSKTRVAAQRIREINPACKVTCNDVFYLPETADQFDLSEYDYVVDAVDTVTAKLLLILRAKEAGVPIISAMGAGNKLDPTAFRVADLYETSVCPLAKVMRRECRKRGIDHLKVVYSTEEPVRPAASGEGATSGAGGEDKAEGVYKGRKDVPGSIAYVPAVAGLILAGEVIRDIILSEKGRKNS